MRLIELRVRNFLRVSSVDIRPAAGVTAIKGANESGKTSTLDALWVAIKGRAVAPAQPIRKGAEKCVIQASLGGDQVELIITRTFTPGKDGADFTQTLDVRAGDGGKVMHKPQATLDALAGQLGFDPLAFERAEPKKQFDMLRSLVPGIDFTNLDMLRGKAYAERTTLNRQADDAAARASGIDLPAGPRPEPLDVSAKLTELANAGRFNSQLARAHADIEAKGTEAERLLDEAERLRVRASTLEKGAARLHSEGVEILSVWSGKQPIDETALREEIAQADRVKGIITLFETRDEHLRQADHYRTRANAMTETINNLDASKANAIAKAKLPVEGLGLGDGEVTFKGLPFSQASAAVKMRTSVAVAMALNPNLKVVLVRDGSLLDKHSLAALAEMAAEHGFDVLLETVDTSVPGGFEIVDGANAEAPASAKKKA